MSVEGRRGDSLHQLRKTEKSRSGVRDCVDAISYGPLSHGGTAAIGLVVGSLAFLVGDAILSSHPGALHELPVLLLCSGGGAAIFLATAVVANYIVGRQIRTERELIRANAPSAEALQNIHFRDLVSLGD